MFSLRSTMLIRASTMHNSWKWTKLGIRCTSHTSTLAGLRPRHYTHLCKPPRQGSRYCEHRRQASRSTDTASSASFHPARTACVSSISCFILRPVSCLNSQMRAFCSSPDVPIGLYHKAAESTLHLVSDAMDQLAEEMPKVEIETEYAADVLSIEVGDHAFVLNKQGPNKQLWLSSPVRGPLRYDLCMQSAAWVNTRDQHELLSALADDVEKLTGARPSFSEADAKVKSILNL